MEKNIQSLLCERIREELENLSGIDLGSDEYKAAIDSIVKLTDRAIDLEKIDVEHEDKQASREQAKQQAEAEQKIKRDQLEASKSQAELERKLKEAQMKFEERDQLIKNCISIAGIIIPVFVTIWGTKKSFEFEKEGTITTIMGRGFINKLLLRK